MNAAHPFDAGLLQDVNERFVTPACERHPVAKTAQPLPRSFERLGIAIDRDQPHIRMALQERFRMSAQPHRRVDQYAVAAVGLEILEHRF